MGSNPTAKMYSASQSNNFLTVHASWDDEAASGVPEWFAFWQAANVTQAIDHDAAGVGEISMPVLACGSSRDVPIPWG